MSIDQFELIIYDTFQMDACMPPLFNKWEEEFKKASYSQWAIGEIINYITKRLYPRTSGTVDEFYIFTQDFMKKMSWYSEVNPKTSKIFRIACDMSADILDLLQAMK